MGALGGDILSVQLRISSGDALAMSLQSMGFKIEDTGDASRSDIRFKEDALMVNGADYKDAIVNIYPARGRPDSSHFKTAQAIKPQDAIDKVQEYFHLGKIKSAGFIWRWSCGDLEPFIALRQHHFRVVDHQANNSEVVGHTAVLRGSSAEVVCIKYPHGYKDFIYAFDVVCNPIKDQIPPDGFIGVLNYFFGES